MQRPLVGLRSASDLGEVFLYRRDAALRLVGDGNAFHRGLNVAENERVVERGPADHDAVAARFLEHAEGVVRALHIAIAEERDPELPLDGSDVRPVAGTAIGLVARAPVNGNGRDSDLFEALQKR